MDSHADEVTARCVPRSTRAGRVPSELTWPSWHDAGTGSFLPRLAGGDKGCTHMYPDSSTAVTGTRHAGEQREDWLSQKERLLSAHQDEGLIPPGQKGEGVGLTPLWKSGWPLPLVSG